MALHSVPIVADFIVSFSVFEHVYNRPACLAAARRHLAPGGNFFLYYDDDHFGNSIDLNVPGSWGGPMREHMNNLVSGLCQ
jgi:Methyltransferase domain